MSIWKRIALAAFITVLVLTLLSFVNGGALTAFLLILLMSSIYAYVVAMISEPFIAYLTGVSTFTVSIIALVLLDMGIFNGGILAVLAMGFVVFAGWAAFGPRDRTRTTARSSAVTTKSPSPCRKALSTVRPTMRKVCNG